MNVTQRDKVKRNIEIVRLLKQGTSQTVIAELYGLTPQSVNQIAKNYGVLRRNLPGHVV